MSPALRARLLYSGGGAGRCASVSVVYAARLVTGGCLVVRRDRGHGYARFTYRYMR